MHIFLLCLQQALVSLLSYFGIQSHIFLCKPKAFILLSILLFCLGVIIVFVFLAIFSSITIFSAWRNDCMLSLVFQQVIVDLLLYIGIYSHALLCKLKAYTLIYILLFWLGVTFPFFFYLFLKQIPYLPHCIQLGTRIAFLAFSLENTSSLRSWKTGLSLSFYSLVLFSCLLFVLSFQIGVRIAVFF